MAQWPHRRRTRRPHYVPLALLIAALAGGWLLFVQLRTSAAEPLTETVDDDDRPWLTPALYGARSETTRAGAILVDTHDSAGPFAMVVGSPGTDPSDWSAVQALLERHGIGSVVYAAPGSRWTASLRRFADNGLAVARRRGRPAVVLTFAGSLDSLLASVPVGHGLREARLVVVSPAPPPDPWWRSVLHRVGLGAASDDARLATWSGAALVVYARDDASAHVEAANRLAALTGHEVATLPGGGLGQAPQHPRDYDWRPLIEFAAGRKRGQDAIVGTDSIVVVVDTSRVIPAPVPTVTPTIRSP